MPTGKPKYGRYDKLLKREIFEFLYSKDFQKNWRVVISRKDLMHGVNYYGECHSGSKEIFLNPFRGNFELFLMTAIHEILHVIRPKAAERLVRYKWEPRVYAAMSPSDITAFFRKLFNRAIWDE